MWDIGFVQHVKHKELELCRTRSSEKKSVEVKTFFQDRNT